MRDARPLAHTRFDVVIIGGGIYGAALLWEATLRGLSAALVEKDDFGGATSAHSLKTIHGGLRYLQSGDLQRVRQSSHERRTLMRIAPHLVHPLPCIVPTYGHGLRSREAMAVALRLNDMITFDRSHDAAPDKVIQRGRLLSPAEVRQRLPGIATSGLTGGALYYDAQVYNSERLTLAFICSALARGAAALNYARATGFLGDPRAVTGVQVRDELSGDTFDVHARLVISAAGPWTHRLLSGLHGQAAPTGGLAKAVNLIVSPLFEAVAVGISDPGDHQRLYFVSPWRGRSMVGTSYTRYDDAPDALSVHERDIDDLLAILNRAYPARALRRDEVSFVHRGLLPLDNARRDGELRLMQHPRILDRHAHGINGLLSVEGVKYTTAREVAERSLDVAFRQWGQTPPPSASARMPLYGGDIDHFDRWLHDALRTNTWQLGQSVLRGLLLNYGSRYTDVLGYLDSNAPPDAQAVMAAQARYAVDHEMAVHLADVIFRRTEAGSAAPPDDAVLAVCAAAMAAKLGWSETRTDQEIDACKGQFAWKGDPK